MFALTDKDYKKVIGYLGLHIITNRFGEHSPYHGMAGVGGMGSTLYYVWKIKWA